MIHTCPKATARTISTLAWLTLRTWERKQVQYAAEQRADEWEHQEATLMAHADAARARSAAAVCTCGACR